jgi:DNA polymerase
VIVALSATALKAVHDDSRVRLQDVLGKTTEHGGYRVVATWHPSFALRVPDSGTGRRVYGEIVAALRMADKLSHSRKG